MWRSSGESKPSLGDEAVSWIVGVLFAAQIAILGLCLIFI